MIDLHCYTNHSIGKYTDDGTLLRVSKSNKIFTVTDYFNIDSHLKKETFYDITGVEVSSYFDGYKVDLLLYGFNPELLKKYKVFQKKYQFDLNTKLLNTLRKRLRNEGIKVPNLVLDITCNAYLTVYQYLNRVKYIDSRFKSYQEFVNFCYNPKYKVYSRWMSCYYEEIAYYEKISKEVGAILFLSDLTRLEPFFKKDKTSLWDILYYVDGIECMNNNYTEEQTINLLSMCRKEFIYGTLGTCYDGSEKYSSLKTFNLLERNNYGSVFNWINSYTDQEIFR